MAIDASYRALPYDPLIKRAMNDRETAEALGFFRTMATDDITKGPYHDDPLWLELVPIARDLVNTHPALLNRALSTRAWDAAYWMLAPNRRAQTDRNPHGLAEICVFGAEEFPCKAVSSVGIPLRLVRPNTAAAVAEYVENILDDAPALFDIEAMQAAHVYKPPRDRALFLSLLNDYARLYRQAAEANEWILVTHD
ncbi:hypothetical protein [Nocardia sp. NPDC051832]|uniref:hypothetical protein n=1 Tax=Nocardia sp. NPDC051832 TaxID=3155673 RepID=UPI00341F5B08